MWKFFTQWLFGNPKSNVQKERFTNRARRVLALAQETAESRGDNLIDTEHLLLGLLHETGGVAYSVLCTFEPDVQKIEQVIAAQIPPRNSDQPTTSILSKEVKQVLEFAVDEGRRMGHSAFGTEHLLLGVARQKNTVAIRVLNQLGITPQMIRDKVRAVLAEKPTSQ